MVVAVTTRLVVSAGWLDDVVVPLVIDIVTTTVAGCAWLSVAKAARPGALPLREIGLGAVGFGLGLLSLALLWPLFR